MGSRKIRGGEMSSHIYPYINVVRYCKNCGKQIPGRSGLYCHAEACQDAKQAAHIAYMKAYAVKMRPWLKKDKQLVRKAIPEKKVEPRHQNGRFCQYEYCSQKKKPLPDGWYYYHPECHTRICNILDRGIDS